MFVQPGGSTGFQLVSLNLEPVRRPLDDFRRIIESLGAIKECVERFSIHASLELPGGVW